MRSTPRDCGAVCVLALGLALVGCDSNTPAMNAVGRTVSAKGKATADGKPLTDGLVTLQPVHEGGSTQAAVGKVKSDGTFELYSVKEGDGAMTGKYTVSVEGSTTKVAPTKKGDPPLVVEVKEGQDVEIKFP